MSLFLFAGEQSGDLHGSHLMAQLKQRPGPLKFSGVGGPRMRNQGLDLVCPMEDFSVMGFSDVIASLPKLMKRFYSIRQAILSLNPEAVILIDYPGFNLRLASSLRKKGFTKPIIQYVSPSIWAHGKGRIETMSRSLNLLLTIYPFERPLFADTSLKVEYVGNPLCEYIHAHSYQAEWKKILSIPEQAPLLALFPGSRAGEIKRNFGSMFEAAVALKKQHPDLIILISAIHAELSAAIQQALEGSTLRLEQDIFLVPATFTYEMMRDSRCAIAKSGTVTLELALHKCPTVVTYKLTALNRFIAKYILRVKLPYYCIVNILSGSDVFPELIEQKFSAKDIFHYLVPLFSEGEKRRACQTACQEIVRLLSTHRASERVAKLIEETVCQ